ncbi:MAG: hypothetical protein E6G97_18040 [Alphaproteobacteria bacterium]|nr:MAG: hypothetical protein E6G97_18040 [Alphaproteobacteria bacterium]
MDARLWDGTTDHVAMLKSLTMPLAPRESLGAATNRKLRLFAVACHRSLPGFLSWADGIDPKQIVLDAERHAEGPSPEENATDDLNSRATATSTWCGVWFAGDSAWGTVNSLVRSTGLFKGPLSPVRAASLLREIFGNPFRPCEAFRAECKLCVGLGRITDGFWLDVECPTCGGVGLVRRTPAWLGPCVMDLARAVGEERLPDGAFVTDRLFVLADALEEAGCTESELLSHLRCTVLCANCGHGVSHLLDEERRLYGGCLWCQSLETMPHRHFPGCWVLDLLLGKE